MKPIANLQSPLVAPAALEWLKATKHGRVLHVFERACNLVNEQGEVLSLVARPAALGPFAVLVDGVVHPAGFLQWVDGASVVWVEGERLVVGKLAVETAAASLWQPRPDWDALQSQSANVAAGLPFVRSMLAAEAPAGSLAVLSNLPNRRTPEESASSDVEWVTPEKSASSDAERASEDALLLPIGRGANQLRQGIATLDLALLQSAAHTLAGLGGGLTPAGDDLLLGAMVALWAIRPESIARPCAETVANTAMPRTTTLSAAYLAAAGRGEVALLWHNLLGAFATADSQGVISATRAILHTGHTSGADMLTGFLLIANLTPDT